VLRVPFLTHTLSFTARGRADRENRTKEQRNGAGRGSTGCGRRGAPGAVGEFEEGLIELLGGTEVVVGGSLDVVWGVFVGLFGLEWVPSGQTTKCQMMPTEMIDCTVPFSQIHPRNIIRLPYSS
jgi:hypothetical protein